jgi:predicted permease
VASLGPAWRLSRPDVLPDLKEQGQQDRGRRGWRGLLAPRHLLVVGQVALSLVLLTAGGLFLRGAMHAAASDPGFRLDGGLVVGLDPSLAGYDETRTAAAYRDVLARVRSLAGVASASLASVVPFGEFTDSRNVERVGRAAGSGRSDPVAAHYTVVAADYFAALGLPVLRGRGFTRAEEGGEQGARVAVVDEPLARQLWPGLDPVGQQLRFAHRDADAPAQQPYEVVGLVPGVRHDLLDRVAPPHVYLAMGGQPRTAMTLHVRLLHGGTAAEHAMLGTIRRELRAVDAAFPVLTARTLEEHRDANIMLWVIRTGATLFTTFGALALLLAAVGLYGVKSYLVSQRTREIGIRMALGAQPRDVLGMVLREGLQLTGTGLAIGLVLSAGVALLLRSLLYRVSPFDPVTFVVAPAVLATAAFVACWLPARRATRVVPVQALRNE